MQLHTEKQITYVDSYDEFPVLFCIYLTGCFFFICIIIWVNSLNCFSAHFPAFNAWTYIQKAVGIWECVCVRAGQCCAMWVTHQWQNLRVRCEGCDFMLVVRSHEWLPFLIPGLKMGGSREAAIFKTTLETAAECHHPVRMMTARSPGTLTVIKHLCLIMLTQIRGISHWGSFPRPLLCLLT